MNGENIIELSLKNNVVTANYKTTHKYTSEKYNLQKVKEGEICSKIYKWMLQ